MAEHFRRKVREALSDEVRVDILRLLVREGRGGLPAGVIASDLEVLQNSIAAQLTVLLNAGLIECECRGRRILYRADLERVQEAAPGLLEGDLNEAPGPVVLWLDALAC